MNLYVPESFGGAGLRLSRRRADRGGALVGLLGHPDLDRLQRPGADAAAARGLRRASSGPTSSGSRRRRCSASFCLTEPGAGSDVAAIPTRAVRRGAGYVISGSKCFITNGGYADFYTVYAKTDPSAGHRGISCFIVPREAGVVVDGHEDKMGQRASNTATVTLPRRRDPGRPPDRRGERGLPDRDDDARPDAPGRRGDGDRHRPRGVRVRGLLRARARPVRRPDRLPPGDPVHASPTWRPRSRPRAC